MKDSKIEWCDDTINPWWGCSKVSPACAHCYAEAWARRWGKGEWTLNGERWVRVHRAQLELDRSARQAIKEQRQRRVFIASMSDFFEERQDLVDPRHRVWDHLLLHGRVSRLRDGRPALVPLLLTKRALCAAEWIRAEGMPDGAMLGVTVEDQFAADERIPLALSAGVPVFLSMEPLLEPVCLFGGDPYALHMGVAWVIAGGESGPQARPSHPDWFRSIRDQCDKAGVPFFFKQWGAWSPIEPMDLPDGTMANGHTLDAFFSDGSRADVDPEDAQWLLRRGKKAAGRMLDGRTHDGDPSRRG